MVFKQWPPLNVLRGFEAAARLGSFHQAAQELHLTQSAISQQIRSLEELLGQPLFHRQGRSVTLTDAGQDLLETTQSVLLQLAMGIQRLEQYRKPSVATSCCWQTACCRWPPPPCWRFLRQSAPPCTGSGSWTGTTGPSRAGKICSCRPGGSTSPIPASCWTLPARDSASPW